MVHLEVEAEVEAAAEVVEEAVEEVVEVEAHLLDNQQPNLLHQGQWQSLATSKIWDNFHSSLMVIEPKQTISLMKSKATSSSIKT